jgi:hypothetical protein
VDAAAVAVGALAAQRARGGARRERGRFAFAAGAVGALALLAPGFVSRTVPYEGPYYPTWAHEPPPYARLPGRVESAQLAGIPLPSNSRQAEWAPFGSRWASGAPLEVRAFLDRWPDELAPLVKVNGEKVELLLLAVEERDLVVREHRAGERLGLEMPLFAARDALARVGKGAAFELELRRSGLGWSARLDDGATLALGPTPGSAWRFWIRADDVSERTRRAGDAVTVGLVFAVVGFSLSRSWTGALGLVLPLAALLVSPPLLGLVATPPREWIAAGAGFALGALLRRAAGAGQRGAIGPT